METLFNGLMLFIIGGFGIILLFAWLVVRVVKWILGPSNDSSIHGTAAGDGGGWGFDDGDGD